LLLPEKVSLADSVSFFANFAVLWLEQVSLELALQLLEMVFLRVTKMQYRNVTTGLLYTVDYAMKVHLKGSSSSIVFNEVLETEPFITEQVQLNPDCIVTYRLAKRAEIIPLGFSAEAALFAIANKRPLKGWHFATSAWRDFADVPLEVTCEGVELRTEGVTLRPSLGGGPLQSALELRARFLEFRLKSGEELLLNVESSFFKDYNIDLIDALNKKRPLPSPKPH